MTPRVRDSRLVLTGRDERARAWGWRSYGQLRYWLGGAVPPDGKPAPGARWSRAVAVKLADSICGCRDELDDNDGRPNSIMCSHANALVNPNVADGPTIPPRVDPVTGEPTDWRARLVSVAAAHRGAQ